MRGEKPKHGAQIRMPDILIVDDEPTIQNLVSSYLTSEGYAVHCAADGEQGLALFRRHRPELVILDVMLPKMDGLEVLQHIRRESECYVLMLTAKSEEMDRVIGLTVGADDYLTKPFSPRELVARVKAILRRGRNPQVTDDLLLVFETLRIDSRRHEVWRDDELVEMTALEFNLLKTLATYAGMVMSREQLISHVWGYDFYGDDRIVDVHIGHIRQKLEPDLANPRYILTVRGVGYKFGEERA
jgi:two-component system alkaline phosphatase synthesis response regulator PhoP